MCDASGSLLVGLGGQGKAAVGARRILLPELRFVFRGQRPEAGEAEPVCGHQENPREIRAPELLLPSAWGRGPGAVPMGKVTSKMVLV